MATIDVLLPVKNGIDYLSESLDSIRQQSFKDWRLLILDHGSTDGSRAMAEQYSQNDSRIQVYGFPEANGLAGLLNHGLDIADCKYVMRHDADDVCYPDRMEITLDAYEQLPGCVVLGGQADMINGSGTAIGEMSLPVGVDRVSASSLFRNPIAHPTVMMDFSAIQEKGIRYGVDFLNALSPEQSLKVNGLAEDYFMFGQLAIQGQCANLPEKLIKYRWHGGNTGATKYRDQMMVSLDISRFLVRSFCVMHGLPCFDPAPFCNLGDALFDVNGRNDFKEEFETMAGILRQGFGSTPDVEREIAFRRVVSTRNDARLVWRYTHFKRQHKPDSGEWNAVRSWLVRRLPGKFSIRVADQGAV